LQDPSVKNQQALTADDLAAYDFLKFSRVSGELKRDMIRCFVLRLLANRGPIEESAIKTRVDEFVGKTTLDAHTYCLNGLHNKGKIQIVNDVPKTYSLTAEEQQRLTDYANDCSHNKIQFREDVQTILNGTALADKTDEVLREFKNLVTQRLESAAIVVDNVDLQYAESENSFLEFLNADINDIEKSKRIYKDIIAICGSNDIIYRLCAGSFISSLASTTEYNGNFPIHQRSVFLDTQVILLILCVAFDDFEPGRIYDYKIARDLISIARNDKNGLSLKFANTYITEVKGHLAQALQLIEIADAEPRKFKLHTNNVFYNHYADLKELGKLPDDITTFKDYLYILFNLEDQDAEDDYKNFLNFSLAGQIEYILKEANIELFYLPSYEHEDTKKSETAFSAVLKNNEKAYSTLEHDVRMGQYLFDQDDKPKLFFISRDHSFDLYRKKYAELFCRSTPYFWQLFTPVNFVNSVDLLEMKFEPQALSEDLLLLVDRDGGKDNAKYFADVNTKLTNLPGITAAERRKRQKLNFELFTNKNYNDIEEDNLSHADMIADKLNRTWDSLYNHLHEKCPDNIEKAFAPLLNDAIYLSVVTNLRDYVESIENDLNTLLKKIDGIIYENSI
jgi:CRP-like cAMP-binding protein